MPRRTPILRSHLHGRPAAIHRTPTRGLLLVCLIALLAGPVGADTEVVDASDANWGFLEEIPAGIGSFGSGPGAPPRGFGSVQMSVDATGRMIFGNQTWNGVRLDQLTALSYWTYRTSGPSAVAISLQLNVDYDLTDGDETWQGRLVFEPANIGATPVAGVWERWDALAGSWWSSGAPGNSVCPQSDPCTTAEVLASFPSAGIHASLGALLLKAGGPWSPAFFGATDSLRVGVDGVDTFFDFEGDASPVVFTDSFESADLTAWSTTATSR